MSQQAGKQALLNVLNTVLKENTRATLDLNVHIADLNKNTLIRANRLDFTTANAANSEFTNSYNKFIETVDRLIPTIDNYRSANESNLSDIELAISVVSDKKIRVANVWLRQERLLVSSGFSAMSTVRTKIYSDPTLINDLFFGKVNRIRSIYQQLEDKGIVIDEGTIPDEAALSTLVRRSSSARDSFYIFPEMVKNAFGSSVNSNSIKVYQLVSQKSGKKLIGALIPDSSTNLFKTVAIVQPDGTKRFYPAKNYIGFKVSIDDTGSVQTEPDAESNTEAVLLDKRLLSTADVGHAYFIDVATGRTPASEKLKLPNEIVEAFNPTQIARVNSEIAKLKRRLNKAHGAVNFAFYKDTIQKKLNSSNTLNTTINNAVVVTFQDFKINSKLSTIEGKIVTRYKELIAKEIFKIPGSNTLKQDIIEISLNKIFKPLATKPLKKLQPTSNIKGKKDINIKTNVKQDKGSLQKVARNKTSINLPKLKLNTVSTQGTANLTNLQNLLNAALVQQVKQNMGSGGRKDVLNLQSGRFAESVKVERLSESRQGMITAFYNYMRNPYGTFSDGGRQQNPKSRDPKLLIAKSIREVAQQQVANRLRSVLV